MLLQQQQQQLTNFFSDPYHYIWSHHFWKKCFRSCGVASCVFRREPLTCERIASLALVNDVQSPPYHAQYVKSYAQSSLAMRFLLKKKQHKIIVTLLLSKCFLRLVTPKENSTILIPSRSRMMMTKIQRRKVQKEHQIWSERWIYHGVNTVQLRAVAPLLVALPWPRAPSLALPPSRAPTWRREWLLLPLKLTLW